MRPYHSGRVDARRLPCGLLGLHPPRQQLLARRSLSDGNRRAYLPKEVWLETTEEDVVIAALEGGVSKLVLNATVAAAGSCWRTLGRFEAITVNGDHLIDESGEQVGTLFSMGSAADVAAAEALALTLRAGQVAVMDAADWKVIPAENLVAAFQSSRARLMAAAGTADEARAMLGALQKGTAGVLLRTNSAEEVQSLLTWLRAREAEASSLALTACRVTRVTPVGMGDRVCVDLASLLRPGEGLLVGSFARSLFLVHSECEESRYINSRPFRVNAGPVHAYVHVGGGRTAYLSELSAGREVAVVDAAGRQRSAVVGRVKIETRPLVLVEAEEPDGSLASVLLQNAETVKLVAPQDGSPRAWRTVAVSDLSVGDEVLLLSQQSAARHTGIAVDEFIVEK